VLAGRFTRYAAIVLALLVVVAMVTVGVKRIRELERPPRDERGIVEDDPQAALLGEDVNPDRTSALLDRVLAIGESQSGITLTTYINEVAPKVERVIDGFAPDTSSASSA